MKQTKANGAGNRAAETKQTQLAIPAPFGGLFDFDTAEIEFEADGINGGYPNVLLVDPQRRFALARRDARKLMPDDIRPVSISDALRWYALVSEVGEGGWGLPSSLFEGAAAALERRASERASR